MIRVSIQIVCLTGLDEVHRGALWRDVALGGAEKFVANHEFLNRCGAQERRKVVRVQVPFFIGAAVSGFLVESHRIRESSLKQIVVTNGDATHDVAQEIPLFPAELIDRSEMALAQHQRFERPNGPKRHDHSKSVVLADNADI